ncbi:hypothetical protein G9A89_007814 [Geosiphon pyriformis]|nr:hypothetical protein G9A89_007814 [Geosiphon pyriformis]
MDKTKQLFDTTILQQLEHFVEKNNLSTQARAIYQIHTAFQNRPEILFNKAIDMVTSNQLGKITNAQFEKLQTQITQTSTIFKKKDQKPPVTVVSGFSYSSLSVLQLLLSCVFDFSVFIALYKGFVFNGWFHKTVSIFYNPKVAGLEIVKFVCFLSLAFKRDIWSVHAKYHAYMEKNRLISLDGSALVLVSGLALGFSAEVVKLLGITNAFGVHFGFCKFCLFFLDISDPVLVHIAV